MPNGNVERINIKKWYFRKSLVKNLQSLAVSPQQSVNKASEIPVA